MGRSIWDKAAVWCGLDRWNGCGIGYGPKEYAIKLRTAILRNERAQSAAQHGMGKFAWNQIVKKFFSIFWKHSGSGEELPTPGLQRKLEREKGNLNTKNTAKRTGSSIPPNKTRACQVSFPGFLARGGNRMEQLARGQKIRNVFQKILCEPERWKGTERRGFARDNNLQALFAWSALFSRPGQ